MISQSFKHELISVEKSIYKILESPVKISSKISHDYGFIQPPMHLRAYRKKTLEFLFNILELRNSQVFSCNNTDSKWGQVRNYKFTQKLLYKVTGFLGAGSLLIAIGQKEGT